MSKIICDGCKRKINKKKLINFKGKKLCGQCKKNGKNNIRIGNVKEIFRDSINEIRKIISYKPGIKNDSPRWKIPSLGLYLTKEEKYVLYKIYISRGLIREEASERVNKICKQMELVSEKLRKQSKDNNELNRKFKEEFAILMEQER